MTGGGLAKLIEECGELLQVAGKRLAYYKTEEHPDGGPPLSQRLEEEIADVMASCIFVIEAHDLDEERITERIALKIELFKSWHKRDDNNVDGIDAR